MSHPTPPQLLDRISRAAEAHSGRMAIMEVCGTHTVSLFRTGIRSQLPRNVKMISGPGCPVCVTTQGYLDAACEIARRDRTIVATYGDMVRVPGRHGSLALMQASGARVEVVYSARDALRVARENPDCEVAFLAVGFETTSPATAATVLEAEHEGISNYSVLTGHKLVVPALEAILSGGKVQVDGFMLPGHVSVILGAAAYREVAAKYAKACVVTGFEATSMLDGIARLAEQISTGRAELDNAYNVAVTESGNPVALKWLDDVFEPGDVEWRAMGTIPASGLLLREKYRRFDATDKLGVEIGPDVEPTGCLCGEVIQGISEPADCGLFGSACTPSQPVGPCMVSTEGACAAWHKYGDLRERSTNS